MISNQPHPNQSLKIAVVGDIHDQWDDDDEAALKHLGVDLVLLVGDFGNESVEVVRAIAALNIPKAAILGNHDAWYTATEWGRKKSPYNHQQEDWVQQQLDLLGVAHVGYGYLDLPELNLSIVGGRPFSWGGSDWKHTEFYQERYGVASFAESTDRIVDAAKQTAYNTIIFMGHCGPTGLGDRADAPCGRDWKPIGGDYGDPDLEAAIAQAKALGKTIPLVTFGHMHHQLRHTKQHLRQKTYISTDGTLYLNAASVPRIVDTDQGRLRNFSLISLQAAQVTQASLLWLNSSFEITTEEILYQPAPLIAKL